ncbi:NHL repeat-containing protein [Leptospira licerasiae]|uniref:NHL repeat protein n=1 Tax=Leptospira licerasiae str. MMD4847 TaxID=1049971 RepID=A0ABN0HBF7_9LEPT|nr:NHL repeat-containing protein [Leptospira licerasiae]EIE00346.1 NHL repeat protein [Leptospira licerasiae serovar Varillal str. VAR 010]EJZ42902.1 NHL repeat protein [Leptospira licerasiae str. MMD4847]
MVLLYRNFPIFAIILTFFLQCGAIPTENPCDPSSDTFFKDQLIKYLINDTSSSCSLAANECGVLKQGESAKIVLGQPDFTSNAFGTGINQVGASGFVLDHQGGAWVSDGNYDRVMHFSAPLRTNQNADIILTTGTSTVPRAIAVDANGGLWVTLSLGDSVLHYPAGMNSSTPSDITLGTGTGSTTQNTMNNPFGVSVDSGGGVWVADYFNSRVLHYSPPLTSGMNADIVLGQADFISYGGGTAVNRMVNPFGVGVDPSGHVWVADTGNHRILRFTPPFSTGMNADLVLGQPDFVTATSATTQVNLSNPNGVSFAANGAVWVADNGNQRAIRFSPPFLSGQAADNVLGEPDFVTRNSTMTISDKLIGSTPAVAVAPCGVWVADSPNYRVLFFP